MKKLKFVSILFSIALHFISSSTVFSQNTNSNESVMIYGTVYDKFTLDSLPFASVRINKNRGFITNQKGEFKIKILKSDTLYFSHIGYFGTEIIPNELDTTHVLFLNILLEKQIYEIDEATIWPYNTYSDFKQAFLDLDTETKDLTNSEINIETLYKHLEAGYLVDKDSYGNYRYDTNLKYIDNKSVLLFSSNPNAGLIPALKKAFRR